MNQLEKYREELMACNEKILEGLLQRNAVVEELMAYKEENKMPMLQPEQEERQRSWLEKQMEGHRHKQEVETVFQAILKSSKKIQARKLFSYNIVLIGFMGSGKSTISEYLHTLFDMEIIEMDQMIAQREGMSISDIFETRGEEYFRNLETSLLIEMQERSNVVISCGGGAALRSENVEAMKKNGRVVLLTASPEVIFERVKDNDERPLLEGRKGVREIAGLMEGRRERYEAAADIVVNTDHKTVLQVCEELVQRLMEMAGE